MGVSPHSEPHKLSDEPIVITGVGAVTPLGNGARTLHERWVAGERALDGGISGTGTSGNLPTVQV